MQVPTGSVTRTLVGLALVCPLACREPATGPVVADRDVLSIEFRPSVDEQIFADGLGLEAAWVVGKQLKAVVAPFCRDGELTVVAPLHFTETTVPTLDVYLRYVEPAEPCVRAGRDTVTIDLHAAFSQHARRHRSGASWRVRLGSQRFPGPASSHSFLFVPLPERDDPGPDSPMTEAEQIALWMSGALESPADLAAAVGVELQSIRDAYRDRIPAVDAIRFVPPHAASSFYMFVDEETADAILRNEYRDWDALNEWIDVQQVDVRHRRVVWVHFRRQLHPREVTERYATLPGVLCARGNAIWSFAGRYLYPRGDAADRSYLFEYGWGDCPAGCITRRYYFIEREGTGFSFRGYWTTGTTERPDWWARAQQNLDLYDSWQHCCQPGDCGVGLDSTEILPGNPNDLWHHAGAQRYTR